MAIPSFPHHFTVAAASLCRLQIPYPCNRPGQTADSLMYIRDPVADIRARQGSGLVNWRQRRTVVRRKYAV